MIDVSIEDVQKMSNLYRTKVKVTTVLVMLTLSGNEIRGKQYMGTYANSE